MVFSSPVFLFIYLPIVLVVYYLVPSRFRNIWLFAVNLVFYGWGEPVYLFLMLGSVLINYLAGLLITRSKEKGTGREKAILIINVAVNLAILGFFKYFDFILSIFGVAPLGIALPIGISFYTFQAMSYPIDVYRGDTPYQKSFLKFGTYVTLFPQLIAGPIVRYKDIAKDLDSRTVDAQRFAYGIQRFIVGLCKKVLLANNIGQLWDVFKATPASELSVLGAWLGIIAFSLQIYFDFSGYSDMAIGLGHMLGFKFLENFNYPYISKSITEFWRRWHISLGTWFRDYVYIPLGGNRKGLGRQIINIMIVWALTGFWHGASWNFLVWGLYYGILLLIEKVFLLKLLDKAPAFVSHIYTLFFVILGWAIFAIEDFSAMGSYIGAMFGIGAAGFVSSQFLYYLRCFGPMLAVLIFACLPVGKKLYARLGEKPRNIVTPILIAAGLLLSTAYLIDSTYNPFLYFRF